MMYLSDCGNYIAIRVKGKTAAYDVIAVDGSKIWFHMRYVPTGYNDKDPRYTHPEFPHMVIGYHNYGRDNKNGRWIPEFILDFADCDTAIKMKIGEGNTITKRYTARFRKPIKKLAWKYKPAKGRRLRDNGYYRSLYKNVRLDYTTGKTGTKTRRLVYL